MNDCIPPALAGASIPKEDILLVPCDVLIPAAIGGVIDETNARDLQCKVGHCNQLTRQIGGSLMR